MGKTGDDEVTETTPAVEQAPETPKAERPAHGPHGPGCHCPWPEAEKPEAPAIQSVEEATSLVETAEAAVEQAISPLQ